MAWIESWWPQLPAPNWYTIGDGSAVVLRDYGIDAIQPLHELSSEGLLALPQLQAIGHQRVLIVKGAGGRTLIRETLEGRGAQVDELVAYRRQPPRMDAGELATVIRDNNCRLVLISSGEGLRNMVSLLDETELGLALDLQLIVPGERVAAEASELGFAHIACAANATDAAMLEAVQHHFTDGG